MSDMDPRLARTVLVANQKGGVGKSSIVAAIGGMLAGPDRRVLIVDADQQGNVTRSDLGVDGDRGQSLAMALQYTQPLTPLRDVRPGLDIVPGGPHLATVGAMVATASSSGLDIAANLAATLADLCAQERYALVLIDSGPGDAPMLDALLDTARYLLVPSCDDDASLEGVELLANRYLRARRRGSVIDLLGVVLFNVNPRANVRNAQVLANIQAMLEGSGAAPFEALIRTDKAAAVDLRARHLTPVELVAVAAGCGVRGRLNRCPKVRGGGRHQRQAHQGRADRRTLGRLHSQGNVRYAGGLRNPGAVGFHHGIGRHGGDG